MAVVEAQALRAEELDDLLTNGKLNDAVEKLQQLEKLAEKVDDDKFGLLNFVQDFVALNPEPTSLLKLLAAGETAAWKSGELRTVFRCFELILLTINKDLPQHDKFARGVAETLATPAILTVIVSFIKNSKHKAAPIKTCLRLLSTLCSTPPTASHAKQILTYFPFDCLFPLVEHRDSRDTNDVRHHLVLFIASILLHIPLPILVEYQKLVPDFVRLIDNVVTGLKLDHAFTIQVFLGVLCEKFLASYALQHRRQEPNEHATGKNPEESTNKLKKSLHLPITHRDLYRQIFSLKHLSAVAELLTQWTGPKQKNADSDAGTNVASDANAVSTSCAQLLKFFFCSQAHPWLATCDLNVVACSTAAADLRNNNFHLTEFLTKHFSDLLRTTSQTNDDDQIIDQRREVLALILSRYPDQILFFLRSTLKPAGKATVADDSSSVSSGSVSSSSFIDDATLLSTIGLLQELDIDMHYFVGKISSLPKALSIILYCALSPIITLDLQVSALRRQRSVDTVAVVINFLHSSLSQLADGLTLLKNIMLSENSRKTVDDFLTTKAALRFVNVETVIKAVQHRSGEGTTAVQTTLLYPFLGFLQLYSKLFNHGKILMPIASNLSAIYLVAVGLSQIDLKRMFFSKSRRKKVDEGRKLIDLVQIIRQCANLKGNEVHLRGQLIQREKESFTWTHFSCSFDDLVILPNVNVHEPVVSVTGMLSFILKVYTSMLKLVDVVLPSNSRTKMPFFQYCENFHQVSETYEQRWNSMASLRFYHPTFKQISQLVDALEALFVRLLSGLGVESDKQLIVMFRLFALSEAKKSVTGCGDGDDVLVERFWNNIVLRTIVKRSAAQKSMTNYFVAALGKQLFFDEKSRQENTATTGAEDGYYKFESEIMWSLVCSVFLPSKAENRLTKTIAEQSRNLKANAVQTKKRSVDDDVKETAGVAGKSFRAESKEKRNRANDHSIVTAANGEQQDSDEASKVATTTFHVPDFCLKNWFNDNFSDIRTHQLLATLYRLQDSNGNDHLLQQPRLNDEVDRTKIVQMRFSASDMFQFVCKHEKFTHLFDDQQQVAAVQTALTADGGDDEKDIEGENRPSSSEKIASSKDLRIAVLDLIVLLDRCCSNSPLNTAGNEKILQALSSNYGATLSPADVRIFALLTRCYAENDTSGLNIPVLPKKLYAERREAAVPADGKIKSIKLEEFLACFDQNALLTTARSFPLHLAVDTTRVPPNYHAENENPMLYDTRYLLLCFAAFLSPAAVQSAENNSVDTSTIKFDKNDPKRRDLTPKPHFPIQKFVASHALQLVLCSLASIDVGTRSLGYYCLQSFTALCRSRKFHGKQQLLAILSGLQRSLWKPHVRLSSMWTLFIGRACELVFLPQERIFRNVADELFQHDTFELRSLPGFTRFVLSNSIGSTTAMPLHRQELSFLLSKVLVHGVRTMLDVDLLNRYGSWHILQALALAQPQLLGDESRIQSQIRQITLTAVQILQPNNKSSKDSERSFFSNERNAVEQLRTLSLLWKDYGLLQFAVSTLFAHCGAYDGSESGIQPLDRLLDQTPERSMQEVFDAATLVHLMFDASRARIVMLKKQADSEAKPTYRILWRSRPPVFACAALLSALECTLYVWCRRVLNASNLLLSAEDAGDVIEDGDDAEDETTLAGDAGCNIMDEKIARLSVKLILDVGACHEQFDLPFAWNLWNECFNFLKRILKSNWFWHRVQQSSDKIKLKNDGKIDRMIDSIVTDIAYWQKGANSLASRRQQQNDKEKLINSLYKFKQERSKWLISTARQVNELLSCL